MDRYVKTIIIDGKYRGTNRIERVIYNAARDGRLSVKKTTLVEGERLDILAGRLYGSGTYWWVIAAASGIGWGGQVPPGTVLTVPISISQIRDIIV